MKIAFVVFARNKAPWIAEILNDNSRHGGAKMDEIHKQLPDRLRELGRKSMGVG